MENDELRKVDPALLNTVKEQVVEAKKLLIETGDELSQDELIELQEHCNLFKYFPELNEFILKSGIEELIYHFLNKDKSVAMVQ
jgi:hypothetical protein